MFGLKGCGKAFGPEAGDGRCFGVGCGYEVWMDCC